MAKRLLQLILAMAVWAAWTALKAQGAPASAPQAGRAGEAFRFELTQTVDDSATGTLVKAVGASRANISGTMHLCPVATLGPRTLWRLTVSEAQPAATATTVLYFDRIQNQRIMSLYRGREVDPAALNHARELAGLFQRPSSTGEIELWSAFGTENLAFTSGAEHAAERSLTYSLGKTSPTNTNKGPFKVTARNGRMQLDAVGRLIHVVDMTTWQSTTVTANDSPSVLGSLEIMIERLEEKSQPLKCEPERTAESTAAVAASLGLIADDGQLHFDMAAQTAAFAKARQQQAASGERAANLLRSSTKPDTRRAASILKADPSQRPEVMGVFEAAIKAKDAKLAIASAGVLAADGAPAAQEAIAKAASDCSDTSVAQRLAYTLFLVPKGSADAALTLLGMARSAARPAALRDVSLLAAASLAHSSADQVAIKNLGAALTAMARDAVDNPQDPMARSIIGASQNLHDAAATPALEILAKHPVKEIAEAAKAAKA